MDDDLDIVGAEFDEFETESEVRDLKVSVNNLALAIRDATTKNDVEDACIENDASEAVANVEEDDVEDFLEPTTTLYDDFEKRTNAERDSYAFRNWSKRLVREDETILDAELEGRNLKAKVNQDLEEQHMKVAAVDDVVEQEVGEGVDDNLEEAEEVADSLAKDENWVLGEVGHWAGFEAEIVKKNAKNFSDFRDQCLSLTYQLTRWSLILSMIS